MTKEELENKIKELETKNSDLKSELEQARSGHNLLYANLAHELKTPLTAIIGFAEDIAAGHDQNDITERIKTIATNGYYLLNILNGIMDLSKIETQRFSLDPSTFSLHNLLFDIEDIMQQQAKSAGNNFTLECIYPLPTTIISDRTKLKQILVNLCNNAIKFTKNGDIELRVCYRRDKHRIEFIVTDNGIGIDSKHLSRIFRPFEQADSSISKNHGGTGLGLFISNQISMLLGNEIKVESTPGKGSVFTVEIDPGHIEESQFIWSEFELRRTSFISHDSAPPLLRGNILIAEDNPDNQKLLELMLSQTGADAVYVINGQEAIDQAINNNFDLILLDVQMPVVNGIEAATKMRDAGVSFPIVAVTANNEKKDMDHLLEIGFDDVICKPINRKEFFDLLANSLRPAPEQRESESISDIEKALNDDPEFQQLTQSFADTLKYYATRLEDAKNKRHWDEMQSLAHKLKGTAGSFGFPKIGTIAAALEKQLKVENGDSAIPLADELLELCKNERH
mgnify:CR=1 FL=1